MLFWGKCHIISTRYLVVIEQNQYFNNVPLSTNSNKTQVKGVLCSRNWCKQRRKGAILEICTYFIWVKTLHFPLAQLSNQIIGQWWTVPIPMHSSEINGLRSTKCSSETLQNLLYFMYKKTHVVLFRFSFRATLYFYLMNALVYVNITNVYVDIDQGIHKVKIQSCTK